MDYGVHLGSDGRIWWRCAGVHKDLAKQVPGHVWYGSVGAFAFPGTPAVATLVTNLAAGRYAIDERVSELARSVERAALAKTADNLPDIPMRVQPWQHQKRAYWFMMGLPAGMLSMEMGTGKTGVAVALMTGKQAKRVLVVCPEKAIEDVWERQVPMFATDGRRVVKLVGSPKRKLAMLDKALSCDEPVALVVSYGSVWRDPLASALLNAGLDMVVLDESHYIKAAGSKVSLFAYRLGRRVPYRLCLTGSPDHDTPLDVYGQYRFLDPGIFGTNYAAFENRYAVKGGYGGRQIIGYRIVPEVNGKPNPFYQPELEREYSEKLWSIAFRVRTNEVLDLPPMLGSALSGEPEVRTFSLSTKAREIYQKLEQEMVAEIGSSVVTAQTALTKMLRLQQITSGHLPVSEFGPDGEAVRTETIDTGRKELLADILADFPAKEPVVVFYRFRFDAQNIKEVATRLGRPYYELSGDRKDLAAWKAEQVAPGTKAGILAVNIRSGNAGVDLTRAAYAVYYSLGLSLGDYEQSVYRLNRPGQTRPTRFIHIVAKNTVDRRVLQAIRDKADVVGYLINLVRQGSELSV